MATWQQLREGVERAWDSLVDGWRQLHDRASGAITRFVPGASKMYPTEQERQELIHRNSGWGVLAAEVFDDDKKVVVRLEAPGLEPDEIDLQVINDMLVIRGEKTLQQEHSNGQYHIIECAYGSFERAIPLPAEVEPEQTKASYKRGILRVELPKIQGRKARKIKVSGS